MVMNQLTVDLPSCAFFLMSIHCAVSIEKCLGFKRHVLIAATGLLAGLIANISGQYSVSSICIFVFAIVKLWKSRVASSSKVRSVIKCFFGVLLLTGTMLAPRILKVWFQSAVIDVYLENGAWIPSADFWMERALIYMLPVSRKFYGGDLSDPRGMAIIMSIYGNEEGMRLWEQAAAGSFVWSISDWFGAFIKHPADFVVTVLNRVVIMMSDDMQRCSLRSLLSSYTMIYLAVLTAGRHTKTLRDFCQARLWLILAALASVIPALVMCVEMRITVSFQCLFFGVALAGPIIPQICATVASSVKQCWKEKSFCSLMDRSFPWAIVGWIVFCLVCLAYYGSLCAASGMGTGMLFRW